MGLDVESSIRVCARPLQGFKVGHGVRENDMVQHQGGKLRL